MDRLDPLKARKAYSMQCKALCCSPVMAVQLVTRVPDELVAAVDKLVEEGAFGSRSEVVREGLTGVVERQRRAAIGEAIVDGYRVRPQDGDGLGLTDAAGAAMIAEEPW